MSLTFGVVRAALSFVIGIVLLVLGVQAWADTIGFQGHAAPARARVIGNRRYVDDKGNVSFCPVLSFRTAVGRAITVQGDNVCQDTPFPHGVSMAIHYRTDRPSTVEVDGFAGTWFNPVVFTALGLLLTIAPAVYARRTWRATHPKPVRIVTGTGDDTTDGPLWAVPTGRPLGEDYIARLLAQPVHASAASRAPSDDDLAAYDAVLSAVPDDPRDEHLYAALKGRILALYRRGDNWRALDDMKRFAALYRDTPDRDHWAYVYDLPGVWYVPHSEAMYHYAGGVLALFLDDDEAALDELRRSVAIEPAYAAAYQVLGIAYDRNGDAAAATRAYEQAVRLDPGSAPALYGLALLCARRHDTNKARDYLERAIAADPADSRYQAARDSLSARSAGRSSTL